jgi:lysyl endopeptidase
VHHSLPASTFSRLLPSAVLLVVSASAASAQDPEVPFGLSHADKLLSTSQIDLYQTPAIDPAAALAAADDGKRLPDDKPRPLQYALPFPVHLAPDQVGTWEEVRVGSREYAVWRLLVLAPGSLHVNLGFTRFWLPKGAQLSVYAADYRVGDDPERLRQFTARDNDPHGELWIPLVPRTDSVIVELAVPPSHREHVKLVLGAINAGFRPIRDFVKGVSGSCNVDVACPQGDPYREEIRSVGVLSRNGSSLCTGSLINNTGAKRPLFVTADHCGVRASNAATVVVYWNFQNSSCRPVNSPSSGSDGDGNLNQFNSGSNFLATFATSDFTLVELDDAPQSAFNVFLAGWDRRAGPFSDGAVGIHHPNVAEKRISLSNRATEDDGGTHHRIWWRPGIGVTEPGSSGSPVYTKQGRFMGQLTGGASACGQPDSDMWDVYGKLARSWDGGGSAATRARDHLDPSGGAPLMIDGRNWNDGGGDTTPPTTSITSPANGATVSGTVSVTASASDDVGVARVEFLVDGGLAATDTSAPYSFSWNTANLPNGSHTVRSRAFDAANNVGQSTLVTVNVSNGGGSPNLALNKPATGSTSCNVNEGPGKAVNGSVSGGLTDKWCSHAAPLFLQVDLGGNFSLNRFVIRHAGAGGESTSFNTRAFDIQVGPSATRLTTVVTVSSNTASVTTHDIAPVTARFVRLNVTTPTQTTNTGARIYELEVYGAGGGGAVFSDGFETNLGWTRNAGGTDTATTGLWARGDPQGTSSSGSAMQPENAATGASALITGLLAGTSVGSDDVDAGTTTIRSPAITLPSTGALTLSFRFYFAHLANSSADDFFRVRILSGGTLTTVFQELGSATVDAASWASASVNLGSFAGQTIRIQVEASDSTAGSLVEAGLDDVSITSP